MISSIVDIQYFAVIPFTLPHSAARLREQKLMESRKKSLQNFGSCAIAFPNVRFSLHYFPVAVFFFMFCSNLYQAQIQDAHTRARALTSAATLSACVHHTINHLIGAQRPVANKFQRRNRRSSLFTNCIYFMRWSLEKCAVCLTLSLFSFHCSSSFAFFFYFRFDLICFVPGRDVDNDVERHREAQLFICVFCSSYF